MCVCALGGGGTRSFSQVLLTFSFATPLLACNVTTTAGDREMQYICLVGLLQCLQDRHRRSCNIPVGGLLVPLSRVCVCVFVCAYICLYYAQCTPLSPVVFISPWSSGIWTGVEVQYLCSTTEMQDCCSMTSTTSTIRLGVMISHLKLIAFDLVFYVSKVVYYLQIPSGLILFTYMCLTSISDFRPLSL